MSTAMNNKLSKHLKELIQESAVPIGNMWQKIEQRIEQEERSAVFLGERSSAKPSFLQLILPKCISPKLAWGMSGAFVAATLALVVAKQSLQQETNLAVDTVRAPAIQLVSHNPVEVDWLRSAGRVQMIQTATNKASIIWIKPRTALNQNREKQGIRVIPERVPQVLSVKSQ